MFAIKYIFFIIFLVHCGLHDRYPEKGSFCEIEMNPAPCLFINFREKILDLGDEKILLSMINRVHYTFQYNGKFFELGMLSENRIFIKEEKDGSKERIFLRRKK